MSSGVISIGDAQLALSVVLVLLAGGVSAVLQLGLLRSLLVGTLRTFVQLMAIGYVLAFIFDCSVREAVRTGMTPTINTMMVVGLVSLPGMMTGQILGGVDPREAVRYQIVVMLMISAAVALACLVLVLSVYRRLFSADGALAADLQRSRPDRS